MTNPIKKWHSAQIQVKDMPFRLKLDKHNFISDDSSSNGDKLHFIRISAINNEMGEGPYSNIVELRKLNTSNLRRFNFRLYFFYK